MQASSDRDQIYKCKRLVTEITFSPLFANKTHKIFPTMISKHGRMLARTILVKNNDVDKSYNMLQRVLNSEGIAKEVRRLQFFERPCDKRSRISYERCVRVYNNEMKTKTQFLMKKNRIDPFPR